MKIANLSRRTNSVMAVFAIVCVTLMSVDIWQALAFQDKTPSPQQPSQAQYKARFNADVRQGIGNEVSFAAASDSIQQVSASVESAERFIQQRSGLRTMSGEGAKRLAQAEHNVLQGKGHRLSVEELIDTLTETVAKRLATLTDEEIERAANTYQATSEGVIGTRASGKWGFLHKDDYVRQVKAGRKWSQRGNPALRKTLRRLVEEEVKERVAYLSEAVQEQFGQAPTNGVTPLQATLIAYSVAADDPMNSSQSNIADMIVYHKQFVSNVEGQQKRPQDSSSIPYGVNGFFHSSPVDLLFNEATINEIITRAEGGKHKQ